MEVQGPQQAKANYSPVSFPGGLSAAAWARIAVISFSLLYFLETAIRASEKRLWYDELCTYYICRLPTFADSWAAVMHGADYNPPLFYVIHRAAMSIFGAGLIAMRLPEMVAFWVLCLSLFVVVRRYRGAVLESSIAMAFPLVTGAYYYAYDARPHGLVLGFCGLAVVCWQRWSGDRSKTAWLVGFGLSLEAAFLTHCYAILLVIPFALVELLNNIQKRAITWRFWLTLAVTGALAVVTFLPLLHSYKVTLGTAGFSEAFPAAVWQIREFYRTLLQSALVLVVIAIALMAFDSSLWRNNHKDGDISSRSLARPVLLLSIAFLAMPVYGLILAKVVHGPFFSRYFLSALTGLCLLIAAGIGTLRQKRTSLAFLTLVCAIIAYSLLTLIYHRLHRQGEELIEPTVKEVLNTDPTDALKTHALLSSTTGNTIPIVTPHLLDFLYLVHYGPRDSARLFPVSLSSNDQPFRLNRAVREWCHVQMNREETFDEFLPAHAHFYLYGPPDALRFLSYVVSKGGQLRMIKTGAEGRFLAEIYMR